MFFPASAEKSPGGRVSSWAGQGRRHSWGCPHDATEANQYRTQSTHAIKLLVDCARLAYHHRNHNHHATSEPQNDHNHHSTYDNCSSHHQRDRSDHTHDKKCVTHDPHYDHNLHHLNNHIPSYHDDKAPCPLGYRSHADAGGGDLFLNDYSTDPNDDSVFIIDNEVTRWRDKTESLENKTSKSNGLFSCLRRSSTYREGDAADLCWSVSVTRGTQVTSGRSSAYFMKVKV